MKTAILIIGIVTFCTILHVKASEEDDFKCIDGVAYMENRCNNCMCNGGALACTQKSCESDEGVKEKTCEVGSTWSEDCNKCWCLKSVGTLCTVNCGKTHMK